MFTVEAHAIIVQDLDGRIIDLNEEAVETYGWPREELLGKSIKTMMSPEIFAKIEELWERCTNAHARETVQGLWWTKSRKKLPVEVTVRLLTNERGEPIGMATIARPTQEAAYVRAAGQRDTQ